MKKSLLTLFLISGMFIAHGQSKSATFKFNNESISLGKINQGSPASTMFEFKNVGKEPLIIKDVKPTCGCTAADFTKTPVKPGRTGFIKITYNAATFGPFNKTITVNSNSSEPLKVLTITGEVLKKS